MTPSVPGSKSASHMSKHRGERQDGRAIHRGRRPLQVALVGSAPPEWHSLNRSYRFYHKALSEHFRVRVFSDFKRRAEEFDRCDVIVAFGRAIGDRNVPRGRRPVLYPVWGGAVRDYAYLTEHNWEFIESERLIVNCRSDAAVLGTISRQSVRRCELLPLPIENVFAPVSTYEAKSLVGLPVRGLAMGFVARLIPEKNLHVFLELLGRVRSALPGRQLSAVVVGDFWADYPGANGISPKYKQYVAAQIAKLGIAPFLKLFPAALTTRQLNLVYNAVDVLVHPTMCVDENFGYAPLEALAAGTPVVATAYGGLKDTLPECPAAILQPTWLTCGGIRADWSAMERDLVRLLASSQRRLSLSAVGARYVRERYSHEALSPVLRDIVIRAAEGRPALLARQKETGLGSRAATIGASTRGGERRGREQWNQQMLPLSRYVSAGVPRIRSASRLRVYGRLCPLRGGRIRLEDPLWSLEYVLPSSQYRALTRLGSNAARARDFASEGCSLRDVQRLVDLGLLVPEGPLRRSRRRHLSGRKYASR